MVFTAYCGNLYGKYNYINFKTTTNSQTKFDYSLITSVIRHFIPNKANANAYVKSP